jgi:hypothetical protein
VPPHLAQSSLLLDLITIVCVGDLSSPVVMKFSFVFSILRVHYHMSMLGLGYGLSMFTKDSYVEAWASVWYGGSGICKR